MVQDVVDEKELARANAKVANGSAANGRPMNGKPQAPAQDAVNERGDETDENIFLFYPNLIGEHSFTVLVVGQTLIIFISQGTPASFSPSLLCTSCRCTLVAAASYTPSLVYLML